METDEILTTQEEGVLSRLENLIEQGLRTFYEVGCALAVIRTKRLYRSTHGSFEDYCRERWGMSRVHAHRLISSSEVVTNLLPTGNTLPSNERQVRPLAKLPPAEQREVWQRVLSTAMDGEVTTADVEAEANHQAQGFPVKPKSVHFSSKHSEHYTPPEVIEAAIECMGQIDLDPCSNSLVDPNVPAARHYTREENGLIHPWAGKVYLNPPYGSEIGRWVEKLIFEYTYANHTEEAIALLPARTDTAWWYALRDYPCCLVHGRLKFGNAEIGAPFPSAIFYLGDGIDRFYNAFGGMGDIWQRVDSEFFGA